MGECICSSCRNLKGIFEESGAVENYECVFGFPSEACEECSVEGCDLTCAHYESDGEESGGTVVKCAACGKELVQVLGSGEKGKVHCVECYLKMCGGGDRT